MGNANNSANGNSRVCTGKNAPGLNQYCYTAGYDAAKQNTTPDAVGEALGAAPCLTNVNANNCYTQGFKDGHSSSSNNCYTHGYKDGDIISDSNGVDIVYHS